MVRTSVLAVGLAALGLGLPDGWDVGQTQRSVGAPSGPAVVSAPSGRLAAVVTPQPSSTGGAAARQAVPVAPGPRGELRVVPGGARDSGSGPVKRFAVEVEGGIRVDPKQFASRVEAILFDRRSWAGSGGYVLRRVDSGRIDFRVALASPALADRLCLPLQTNGIFSCASGPRAVVNLMRWRQGADAYRDRLAAYRTYVVNHEVGHVLGHEHRACAGEGGRAPVMMQQTKGVGPCDANAWPLRAERHYPWPT